MSDHSTVVDLLRLRALHSPDRVAYTFLHNLEDEASLTYEELDRHACAIAARLQTQSVIGQRALLLYPPGLEYISAFFGCLYAGIVAVPAYPPRQNRAASRLDAIVADAQIDFVLSLSQFMPNITRLFVPEAHKREVQYFATDVPKLYPAGDYRPSLVTPETLAFLQYTSGSTATPKGVMLSHANLLHNLALVYRHCAYNTTSRAVSWLPPYHDLGLIGGILQPLYGDFPVTLMSPVFFLQSPLRWLQVISRVCATTSGGPNFAYELCIRKSTFEQRMGIDLASWKVAFSGAEPIQPTTLARFVEAFAPHGFRAEALFPCYGLAESTLIVSGGSKAALPMVSGFEEEALS